MHCESHTYTSPRLEKKSLNLTAHRYDVRFENKQVSMKKLNENRPFGGKIFIPAPNALWQLHVHLHEAETNLWKLTTRQYDVLLDN